jgi:hypothetical protein
MALRAALGPAPIATLSSGWKAPDIARHGICPALRRTSPMNRRLLIRFVGLAAIGLVAAASASTPDVVF